LNSLLFSGNQHVQAKFIAECPYEPSGINSECQSTQ
jgi:hypothetical protein